MESTDSVVGVEVGAWAGLEEQRGALTRLLERRCRDRNEVEDVVQEAFLRAARYRRGLTRPDKLGAWIASIALNVLTDRQRREARVRKRSIDDAVCESVAVPEPSDELGSLGAEVRCGNWLVDRDRALRCLSEELDGLAPADRRLLMAFYGGRESCREVAAKDELSPGLVKVRLFRARLRLLRAVNRRFSLCETLPRPPAA